MFISSLKRAVLGVPRNLHELVNKVIVYILILGIIMYLTGGIFVHHSSKKNKETIQTTVDTLVAQENATPTDFSSRVLQAPVGLSMEEEQEKILSLYGSDWDKEKLTRMFDDCVILGDSIVEAGALYQWLGNNMVQGEVGLSITNAESLINSGISSQPSVVFLYFGTNDLGRFNGDVDMFIDPYRAQIEKILEKLPRAYIFVSAIFPGSDATMAANSWYENRAPYNEALKAMCGELNVTYVDACFILERMPELFDQDGIHPVSEFYPMWFTYLADYAGLNTEEEETTDENADENSVENADENAGATSDDTASTETSDATVNEAGDEGANE